MDLKGNFMLIRVRFSKLGSLKFIGHLDVMRYFQKVLSRSGLPVKYTQGFHPHQIMSFASPLGVGLTSDGEYMDFELEEDLPEDVIYNALQSSLTDGFQISKISILNPRVLNVKKVSAMALVDSADYYIYQKPDTCINSDETASFMAAVSGLLSAPELVITKKTKTSEKELDIKPYIYDTAFTLEDFLRDRVLDAAYKDAVKCSVPEDEGMKLYLHLSAGSAMNLKPETILEEVLKQYSSGLTINDFGIHRLEMYHSDEKGTRIPLWDIR